MKIGIIGAGFSGTAVAATLHRLGRRDIDIILFEKRGCFGTGEAYSTPYPFHLLNVRAHDMSAFEDDPDHFLNWLIAHPDAKTSLDQTRPIGDQFAPRFLYGEYLKSLLKTIHSDLSGKTALTLVPEEVTKVLPTGCQVTLTLKDQRQVNVDKVVLALGNSAPAAFPFPMPSDVGCIANPWDYTAIDQIGKNEPVLIVGTGLSMIDAVLSLYHQKHRGKIYAVSRHGLLPLPHTETKSSFSFAKEQLPNELIELMRYLRSRSKDHINEGGDWRSVVNALRKHIPTLWGNVTLSDKKQFLRHLLPYWNIHRHRVHSKITDLFAILSDKQQLTIFSGRVAGVEQGVATIQLRHTPDVSQIEIKWLINCMGPSLGMTAVCQPLAYSLMQQGIVSFDSLHLGFDISDSGALKWPSGDESSCLYSLGPPIKGMFWESVAVPDIRAQAFTLVQHLLN